LHPILEAIQELPDDISFLSSVRSKYCPIKHISGTHNIALAKLIPLDELHGVIDAPNKRIRPQRINKYKDLLEVPQAIAEARGD
jgi:hypothetical protein